MYEQDVFAGHLNEMKTLAELQEESTFSPDQTRRRVQALVQHEVLKRKRLPHARNKYVYEGKGVAQLQRIAKLEELLPPKKALRQVIEERQGRSTTEDPGVGQLILLVKELLKLMAEQKHGIACLQHNFNRLQAATGKLALEMLAKQ